MKVRNPYDPPGMEAGALGTGLSLLDWKRAVKVFVGWTVASALLGGAAEVVQAGYALHNFGAECRVVGVVAVGALRAGGARVVVTAATVALVIAIHRRSVPSDPMARTSRLWPVLLALPITAPAAACLIVGAAFAIASLALGVPFHVSWTSIIDFVRPVDPLFGFLAAAISATLFGIAAPTAIRFMVVTRRGLPIKIAAALLASLALNTAVGATLNAVSSATDTFAPAAGTTGFVAGPSHCRTAILVDPVGTWIPVDDHEGHATTAVKPLLAHSCESDRSGSGSSEAIRRTAGQVSDASIADHTTRFRGGHRR